MAARAKRALVAFLHFRLRLLRGPWIETTTLTKPLEHRIQIANDLQLRTLPLRNGVARVASTAQTERDNGVNDRDRDPNPGYSGGSGKSISSVNRDNEANRIAAQNEAAKRAQQGQIVKNKDLAKKIALGTALDAERKIALAGGFTFFRSSDGKFYTTDPNAPQTLQDALARRSVPYTPEAHPNAFNANVNHGRAF
jgi:hypothetical protein